MKSKLLPLLLLFFLMIGASPDDFDNPSDYFPVLMQREDLEKSVKFLDAREIDRPGKIYYKDQVIFLNEKYKGFHLIDNSDPSNPRNMGFLNIPGSIDIAIKNNSLLADNATDLVSIDLTNPELPVVTERIKNVFPESTPPDLDYIPYMFTPDNRPRNTVIVGWVKLDN